MNSLVRRLRRHMPAWLAGLALALLLLLLLALTSVLNESVQRGVTQRQTAVTQSDAQARCNVLRGRPQREQCLVQPTGPR